MASPAEPPLQVLRRLETGPTGLDEADAQARLIRFGENVLAGGPADRPLWRLARAAMNPFVLVLLALAVASFATDDQGGAALIAGMAALSCYLQFRQEGRSDRAALALRDLVATTASVARRPVGGTPAVVRELPIEQVVPGDIVHLTAGAMVPADVLVIRSAGLTVDQAVLTGESLPVAKSADPTDDSADTLDDPRRCFMGSTVASGTGVAVVVATGTRTRLAAAAQSAMRTFPRMGETTFDHGVARVSRMLIFFMLACVPLVLVVSALAQGLTLQTVLFAVSVAVGLTPEMLPVVITTALTRGAQALARRGVIVKRLPAMHNAGAMDVLCTDKTGTLTEDRVAVDCALDAAGAPGPAVLRWARVNSEAADVPDTLDEAILSAAATGENEDVSVVGTVPFDSHRRRSTVVVRRPGALGVDTLVTKGAVEDVLARCRDAWAGGVTVPLDAAGVAERAEGLQRTGVRVLAVAIADRAARTSGYRESDERDLTLVGLIGFRDRPRDSAAAAVAALAARSIAIKVLTGDHPAVAARVCRDAGIAVEPIVRGSDVDELGDEELSALAERVAVFARMDAAQKARVVTALKANGHSVGFLGDGVNDVPALTTADVGICVESAADATREAADVILASPDLRSVAEAVTHGRRTFGNVIKYLKITVSANVGNVISMLIASVALPFLPMLPLLILIQNLCFDLSQLTLAFDNIDDATLRRPRTFDIPDLVRFVLVLGPINTVADVATFAILWHLTGGHPGAIRQEIFQSGWFAENLLTQAIAVHLLRARRLPSRRNHAARPVLAATVALAVIGLVLPFLPISTIRAVPAGFFPLLAAVAAVFVLANVAVKAAYQRVWSRWM